MNPVKLAEYNIWANDRTRELLKDLTEEEFTREVIPPYMNIRRLVVHIVLAVEYNLRGKVQGEKFDPYDLGDSLGAKPIKELLDHWRSVDLQLKEYASSHLDEEYTFPNFLGEGEMKVDHDDYFAQYLIHTVHHRGQIMSALRLMAKEAAGTDYLFYLSHLHSEGN